MNDDTAKIGPYRVSGHVVRHPNGKLASGKLVAPVKIGGLAFEAGHYLDLDPQGRPTAGRAGGRFVRVSADGEVTPVDLAPAAASWAVERDGRYECSISNGEFACGGTGNGEGARFAEWGTAVPVREFLAGKLYSRNTNPTVVPLEKKLAALEGAEAATAFATGMAAISNSLFALLKPGDRVVSVKDTYGGTNRIFTDFLPRWGVEVTLCDTSDEAAILAETGKGCAVLYLETPTNPTLKVLDLAKLSAAGKRAGAIVVVDNTFATPINQNPLRHGADLVLHSATKFLGGHSDALGGLVAGSEALVRRVFQFREINGASISPMAAYLILRGMKTLELRVERQNESALRIASFLAEHAKVTGVYYPGLKSHPNHAAAARQMRGFGGMLSFAIEGDMDTVKRFLPRLKLAHRAASLGSVSTMAGIPRTTSHVELSDEQRKKTGIPETLIRYSVGIENPEDLLADLQQALASI